MGRKNKRKSTEYRDRLGFNPRKYIRPSIAGGSAYSPTYPYSNPYSNYRRRENPIPRRGDIWFAELGEHPGTSVQGGCRPVFIVSNDVGNTHAETVNVLPMTRHLKRPNLPCHTQLDPAALSNTYQKLDASMILAEQITTISKSQLRNYAGKVTDEELLNQIDQAVSTQLGLDDEHNGSIARTSLKE